MYFQGAKLGEGSFGQVVRCVNLNTKKECAMKIIKKSLMAVSKTHVDLMD